MNEFIFGLFFSFLITIYHFYRSIIIEMVYVGNRSKIELKSIGVIISMRVKKIFEQHLTNYLTLNRNKIVFSVLSYGLLALLYYFTNIASFSNNYIWPFIIYILIRLIEIVGTRGLIISNLYNEMVLIIMLFFLFITLMVSSSKIHLVLASVTGLYLVDIVISEKQHISSYVSSVKYFAHYYLFTKMIIDSAVITENLYSVIISSILTFIFTAWFMFLNSYGLFVPNANTKFRGYSAPMLILVLSMISWMVYDAI